MDVAKQLWQLRSCSCYFMSGQELSETLRVTTRGTNKGSLKYDELAERTLSVSG